MLKRAVDNQTVSTRPVEDPVEDLPQNRMAKLRVSRISLVGHQAGLPSGPNTAPVYLMPSSRLATDGEVGSEDSTGENRGLSMSR